MTSVTFGVSYAAVEVSEIQAAAGMSTMFHRAVAQTHNHCGTAGICLQANREMDVCEDVYVGMIQQ